jgi:hypothetical protein
MTDLLDAAKALQARKNQKIETETSGRPAKNIKQAVEKRDSRPRGVSAAQARKTERKGPQGERQFGAPLSTPTPDLDRAIDAEVQKLRQRQSTDQAN